MLELIQKRFQTVVLGVIVGTLSLTFVLTFQAPSSRGGCNPASLPYAARVEGTTITEGDYRAAFTLLGFHRFPVERARSLRLRELTMDGLIERELLANEAERLGFVADAREVMRQVAETGVVRSTPPVDAPEGYPGPEIPQSFEDRNGQFSSKNMRRYIQNYLRRSVEEFERWQVREALADQAREAVLAGVTVSPAEVRDEYVRATERAKINYARFSPLYFRDRVQATEDEIRTWMASHQSEVDEEYTRQRHRYTGLEQQRRARHILIKAGSDASEADRAAARGRAEALLAQAQAGADFAELARANSEDPGSARRGGDLGWNARGRMVAPFDEAQFTTEPGQITDHVVESTFGYHVIRVEGRREGDVPEDEAKRELAETLYQRARAGEVAREQADRALAYLREGHSAAELDARLAWDWAEAPAPAADGTAPEAPERDSFAPQIRESRSFGRTETPVSGATGAGALTRAAFEATLESPLPAEPIQLGEDWYVFRLEERTEATEEGFDEETRTRIGGQLLLAKRVEALRVYVHRLRERAQADGRIRVNDAVLSYGDEGASDEDGGEDGEGGEGSASGGEAESALDRPRGALAPS